MNQVPTRAAVDVKLDYRALEAAAITAAAIDKKVLRKIQARIRRGSKVLVSAVQGLSPVLTGEQASGYRISVRYPREGIVMELRNNTVAAAITEYAGAKSAGSTDRGKALIRTLNERYGVNEPGQGGPRSRFMWKAWEQSRPALYTELNRIVAEATSELQKEWGDA